MNEKEKQRRIEKLSLEPDLDRIKELQTTASTCIISYIIGNVKGLYELGMIDDEKFDDLYSKLTALYMREQRM